MVFCPIELDFFENSLISGADHAQSIDCVVMADGN
jgi:hypothetical protein